MRALVAFFFFFVLLFGVGSIILGAPFDSTASSGDDPLLSLAGVFDNSQQTNGSLVVDRGDDDAALDSPCTDAADDCTLRGALNIANSDGKDTAITFAAHYMIDLNSPLPPISAPGTTIKALPEQEVHVNGNNTAGSVFHITTNSVEIVGLRIYGAGPDMHNILITDAAHNVVIARNVIGDGDGPAGNCGSSDSSYGGIYINALGTVEKGQRAWIFGNIIECHHGIPGDAITIVTDKVIVGKNKEDKSGPAQLNIIRDNNGLGVNLGDSEGNVVSNCILSDNRAGPVVMKNFNNDWMNNKIID